jgi:hypothetical protein
MKKILISLIVLVLIITVLLAYLGVLPFISPLMAKPRDLGVKSDPGLVKSFDATHEMKNELPGGVVPEDREPNYSGSKELDVLITSAEITSILEYWKNQYGRTPIRDVQVKINSDGTGEASGILETATAILMAKQLGYSDVDIEKGKSYARFIAGDLPFYISGSVEVNNNQVKLNASEIEIGRVSLPMAIADPVAKASANMVERRMQQVPGVDIEKLTLENGAVHLIGKIPDTIK